MPSCLEMIVCSMFRVFFLLLAPRDCRPRRAACLFQPHSSELTADAARFHVVRHFRAPRGKRWLGPRRRHDRLSGHTWCDVVCCVLQFCMSNLIWVCSTVRAYVYVYFVCMYSFFSSFLSFSPPLFLFIFFIHVFVCLCISCMYVCTAPFVPYGIVSYRIASYRIVSYVVCVSRRG